MTCLVKHPTDPWIITLSLVLCEKLSFATREYMNLNCLNRVFPCMFIYLSDIPKHKIALCFACCHYGNGGNWQDHAEVLSSLLFWPRCSSQ